MLQSLSHRLSHRFVRIPVLAAALAVSGGLVVGCQSDGSGSPRAGTDDRGTLRGPGNDSRGNDSGTYSSKSNSPYSSSSNSSSSNSSSSNSSYSNSSARTASERMGMGPVTPADKAFLVSASASNRAEITAAEMALKKSQNPQVQSYARQMIQDHKQAEEKLQSLARSKGVDISAEIPQDLRSASKELAGLDGASFDKQYFAVNHAAHLKTLAGVQHAAQNADDPDVRRLAQELLPVIANHTSQAGAAAGHSMSGHDMNNMNNNNMNNSSVPR